VLCELRSTRPGSSSASHARHCVWAKGFTYYESWDSGPRL